MGSHESAFACRVRADENRGSRLTEEAEGDVLRRWAAEHLERLGFMPSWVWAWL
jgi:hypothetical protein